MPPLAFPLSSVQRQRWLASEARRATPDQLTIRLRLCGPLDRRALCAALDRIVARHALLRSAFRSIDGEPMQLVTTSERGFELITARQRGRQTLEQLTQQELLEPLDLADGRPVRGRLLRLGGGEHVLWITLHRLVADSASVALLLHELAVLYGASVAGQADPLPPLPMQYAEYAVREQQPSAGAEVAGPLEFWRQRLIDAPERVELELQPPAAPAATSRQAIVPHHASSRVRLKLAAKLGPQLHALARSHEVEPFGVLLASWAALLGRWCGREELLIGRRASARESCELAPLIGPLEHTLPLRISLPADATVGQLLEQAREVVAAAEAHAALGWEHVAQTLETERGAAAARLPPVQLLLGLDDTRVGPSTALALPLPGLELRELVVESATLLGELSLALRETDGRLIARLEYAAGLYARDTVKRLAAAWQVLLEALVSAPPEQRMSRLPILSPAERTCVVQRFNDTAMALPGERLIHELFEQQVERALDAQALEHAGRSLSYAELNGRANQLAGLLRERGVGPDRIVAVCLERSPEMIVALLAILKAGGAYLPLDPHYPRERLAHMLEDAAPALVLTSAALRTALPPTRAAVLELEALAALLARQAAQNLPAAQLGLRPEHLLYVIYTSGSTGRPKGTAMPHRAMVNLIEWHRWVFGETPGRRVLQFAALSFDVAFQEIFSTLCTGGTLILLDEWVRRDVRALTELLTRRAVERLFLPPLMLQSLAEHADSTGVVPGSVRDVICAGEPLRITPEIRAFFARLPAARLHNHYGPTETHVVTALTLSGDAQTWPALPPIGRPIANTQAYVLDAHGEPAPIGVTGELHLGGANLARGYLHRPELTAERFIADPFSGEPGARLYRTGDLARWRPDERLEYLGRNDDQVKLRGFRIELGEIEAHLTEHPHVRQAAVMAREDAPGEKRLVAYVVAHPSSPGRGGAADSGGEVSAEVLREHLKAHLPEHMLPVAYVRLEHLPLTANGKLDRRALPAPEMDDLVRRTYEPPRGETEQLLAGIWQELLKVGRIGRHDNFFALGGHSLLIVQLIERLRQVGLSAEPRCFFASADLAALARALTRAAPEPDGIPPNLIPPGCEAITPEMLTLVQLEPEHIACIVRAVPGGAGNVQDIYPLAPLQEGMLFHHLLGGPEGDAYARPMLLSLPSRKALDAFTVALQRLIDRHDVLRTAILWDKLPRPVQVVWRRAILPVEELSLRPDQDARAQLEARMTQERKRLDLRKAPLLHLEIAVDAREHRQLALLHTHHLVFDNESLRVLFAEVQAQMQQRAPSLSEPLAYREHVARTLAYASTHGAQAFFREKLADVNEPTFPFGLHATRGGSGVQRAREALEPQLTKRMRVLARRFGVSAATLFHAAWALVVARTSGRDDIVFGTVLSGRLRSGLEARAALGMFINTLPIRLRLRSVSAAALVDQARAELAALLEHEQASLALAQRCSGVEGSAPLFTALLNFLHEAAPRAGHDGTATSQVRLLEIREWTDYPIVMSVADRGDTFVFDSQTNSRIDPGRLIGYLETALRSLLTALEESPQKTALELEVVPETERRLILEAFNATDRAFPRDKTVHQIFEEQARRTSGAIALVQADERLTYEQLDARANQLARYLLAGGMHAGECIPIVMERSVRLLIAQLAVLKAGGAYLPIDPQLPLERQRFMIEDCATRRVLAVGRTPATQPGGPQWIDLEAIEHALAQWPDEKLDAPCLAAAPAYVMYTSGSTGIPKGVVVPHSAVVRLVVNPDYVRIGPDDCVVHSSNPAFDASTFEIWGALLNGARVLVVPPCVALDAARFAAILRDEGATILWLTVGLFNQYADALADTFSRLRYLITGGDIVDPPTLGRVLDRNPPQHLLNAYGPTECTTFTTTYAVKAADAHAASIPIGRPMSNAKVYILDPGCRPMPIGAVGEIFIGGAGVALGYLNRAELTAQRFVPDPWSADPAARLYRTGDLGRWREDGNIEFIGRNDSQVKIRGFRIEPAEIETQLLRHPDIKEAAVLARTDSRGEKHLVAYVVARAAADPGPESLRAYLSALLPSYMVPSAFVNLERLPLTANGKLDRRALPAPQTDAFASRDYQPPHGGIEMFLAEAWQQLLGVERVGRNDHFFDLGGHSLLAMQLLARVRASLCVELPIRVLFEHPTLRQLAARLQQLRQARLRERLTQGGGDLQALLEQVASMPESRVRELMSELTTRGRR